MLVLKSTLMAQGDIKHSVGIFYYWFPNAHFRCEKATNIYFSITDIQCVLIMHSTLGSIWKSIITIPTECWTDPEPSKWTYYIWKRSTRQCGSAKFSENSNNLHNRISADSVGYTAKFERAQNLLLLFHLQSTVIQTMLLSLHLFIHGVWMGFRLLTCDGSMGLHSQGCKRSLNPHTRVRYITRKLPLGLNKVNGWAHCSASTMPRKWFLVSWEKW